MFKFIYSKKDEGIYRIRRIFGIKIVTKPIELQIMYRLSNIENKIDNLENIRIKDQLFKLESYKIYSNNYKKISL